MWTLCDHEVLPHIKALYQVPISETQACIEGKELNTGRSRIQILILVESIKEYLRSLQSSLVVDPSY